MHPARGGNWCRGGVVVSSFPRPPDTGRRPIGSGPPAGFAAGPRQSQAKEMPVAAASNVSKQRNAGWSDRVRSAH